MSRLVLLRVAFCVVAASSLVVILFMLVTDRLLAAAIIGVSSCLCLIVIGKASIHFFRSSRSGARDVATVDQLRRNAVAIMTTGLSAMLAGAVLIMVWPGVIADFLLFWVSPGLILGGGIVYWYARSERSKSGERQS